MKWVTRLAVGRPGSMEGTDAKVVNGEEEVQSAGKIMINRTGTGSFFFGRSAQIAEIRPSAPGHSNRVLVRKM